MTPEEKAPRFKVYDTRSAAGVFAWVEEAGPTREQVLQVARGNVRIGVFSPADVDALIAAGYVELRQPDPADR